MNSDAVLDAIAEGLADPIFVVDCAFQYTYFNRAHAALMQEIYDADVKIGHILQEYQTPEDWARTRQNLIRACRGEVVVVNAASVLEDHRHRRFDIRYQPVRDAAGAVVGVAVIAEDVTEREAALTAAQVSERRFRGLVENSADAIGLLAPDGTVIYDSPSAPGMLGYEPDEWLGRSALSLVHPEDMPSVMEALGTVVQTPGAREHRSFRVRHNQGHWLHIEATATNLLDEPAIGGIVLNYRDVTERVQTEHLLRESEARLREVWETTSDAMVVSTVSGTMVSANPAFLRLYGYSLDEIIGASISIIFPRVARDEVLAAYKAIFELESPPPPIESVVYRSDGTERVVESQATFMHMGGRRVLMLSTIRDITDRKAAEEALRDSNRQLEEAMEELRRTQTQLVRQERLAAVGQLAAGIAHDFNNILSVILLQVQLALRTPELQPRLGERLNTVMLQAGRAANLVQQILDFSRSTVLQTRPLEVWPFFEAQVELLRRIIPENIQIRLAGDAPDIMLNADPTRLQQFLTNLAINARDAMPNGGELSIELKLIKERQGDDSGTRAADVGVPGAGWLRIRVADTGTGIAPEILTHIFEPFFTTKEPGKGTGLGLAQVYGIVRQHNGYVDVQSEMGRGTVFTIDLPIMDQGTASRPIAPAADKLPLGEGEAILVVEDDPELRAVLVDTLASLNYVPVTARDGREALAKLSADAHGIALVLSDLTMPNMGGQALFEHLQKQDNHIPVVILSGHQAAGELESLRTEGLAGWLPKPPEILQLAHLLDQILAKKRTG